MKKIEYLTVQHGSEVYYKLGSEWITWNVFYLNNIKMATMLRYV